MKSMQHSKKGDLTFMNYYLYTYLLYLFELTAKFVEELQSLRRFNFISIFLHQ